ncbi:MAG: COG3650 family protein [Qipengyuania vulgaris]
MTKQFAIAGTLLLLAACQSQEGGAGSGPTPAYSGIGEDETVFLTGTEPFWGGEIEGGEARYTTPEDQDGARFDVQRFAGNNGLSFTGNIDGRSFDLMVTPGDCSDGMSDRTYPFVATLDLDGEQRNGCAWTDKQSFSGPAHP